MRILVPYNWELVCRKTFVLSTGDPRFPIRRGSRAAPLFSFPPARNAAGVTGVQRSG